MSRYRTIFSKLVSHVTHQIEIPRRVLSQWLQFAVHHVAECNCKKRLAMSKKGGTRIGAGRPLAGGGRYEVYLGMGAEATVVIIQFDCVQVSTYLQLTRMRVAQAADRNTGLSGRRLLQCHMYLCPCTYNGIPSICTLERVTIIQYVCDLLRCP